MRYKYFILFGFFLITGCATSTSITNIIPFPYTQQEFGSDLGKFEYKPSAIGKVTPYQIMNTASSGLFIGVNVSDLVRLTTAKELENHGFNIGNKYPYQISGDVVDFMADDLGFNVDWRYSVKYKIIRKSDSKLLFEKEYKADSLRTGKLGSEMVTTSVHTLIISSFNKFITDKDVNIFYPVSDNSTNTKP